MRFPGIFILVVTFLAQQGVVAFDRLHNLLKSRATPHCGSAATTVPRHSRAKDDGNLHKFPTPRTKIIMTMIPFPRQVHPPFLNQKVVHPKVSSSSVVPRFSTALRGGSVVWAATTTTTTTAWIGPALLCATAYAMYNLFLKKAATAGMDPVLGGVFMQVGASIATLLLLAQRYVMKKSAFWNATTSTATTTPMTRTAILWAIAAGVSVGGAELLSFVVSGMGVPATQSIPVLIGGSVLIGTLLGRLWLGELLKSQGWLGVALISLGIALVGMNSPHGLH